MLVSSWVLGALNGGVSTPVGTSCTRWETATVLEFDTVVTGGPGITRRNSNGELERLFVRTCGTREQFVWVGAYSGRVLAQVALDRLLARLPRPQVAVSPPVEAMVVNVESWLGVTPVDAVTVTSSIPGLSATATGRVVGLRWVTGSQVAGDVAVVECVPWGSSERATGGCVWSPLFPSVPQVTGFDDYRYHGRVELVWAVSWTATDGTRGDLGELVTSTPIVMAVREIQTIGG
jgi:hypothetical protein